MRVLVTGANGFVGRHLVEHLHQRGHQVTSAVRRSTTAPENSAELVIDSIDGETNWDGLLAGYDTVVHLAARVHVMNETSDDPLREFRSVNSLGTAALARAAAVQGVPRFVFLSSIKVNGEETTGSAFTAHDLPRPVDPYGQSKLEAEEALREIEATSSLRVAIVRTPLVYGPGVGGNFIRFLEAAHRGLPLPLASVDNRRTMASVWNLVDLLEKSVSDPKSEGGLILAGDAFSPSTPQLFEALCTAMNKKSRLFRVPVSVLELAGRAVGKSSVISRLVGSLEVSSGSCTTSWRWTPPLEFQQSIARTVDWFLAEKRSRSE